MTASTTAHSVLETVYGIPSTLCGPSATMVPKTATITTANQ